MKLNKGFTLYVCPICENKVGLRDATYPPICNNRGRHKARDMKPQPLPQGEPAQ